VFKLKSFLVRFFAVFAVFFTCMTATMSQSCATVTFAVNKSDSFLAFELAAKGEFKVYCGATQQNPAMESSSCTTANGCSFSCLTGNCTITKSSVEPIKFRCNFSGSGSTTVYPSFKNNTQNPPLGYNSNKPVINFNVIYNDNDSSEILSVRKIKKIFSVSGGGFGGVFPTLSNADSGTSNQPSFENLFSGAVNLSGNIPSDLFCSGSSNYETSDAIYGAPSVSMFRSSFSTVGGWNSSSVSLPSGLFRCLSGPAAEKVFMETFFGANVASENTGIGADFFGRLTTPAVSMFESTFVKCNGGVTLPLSGDLFGTLDGAGASNMFKETFSGSCVSGEITSNFFGNITTYAADMFSSTFLGSAISGYISPNLFRGLTGSYYTNNSTGILNSMSSMFSGSNLATTCPGNLSVYNTDNNLYQAAQNGGNSSVWGGKVACDDRATVTVNAGSHVNSIYISGWAASDNTSRYKKMLIGETVDLSNAVYYNNGFDAGYYGYDLSGSGSLSNGVYTAGATDATITINATTLSAPNVTLTASNSSQVYNYISPVILSASTGTNYASGVDVYYSFGESDSQNGIYTYATPSTGLGSMTKQIQSNDYLGTKYHKVKAYATDGTITSDSAESYSRTVTLDQKEISFDANGGTLNGISTGFIRYNSANLYNGSVSTTGVTVPSASKNNAIFNGWYTEASGGDQVYSSATNPQLQANVNGYTNASGQWARTSGTTLYAQFDTCTCTLGDNVAICSASGVSGNRCQYSYTCNNGYHVENSDATQGSFTAPNAGVGNNTSPSCLPNTYTITVRAGAGINSVVGSGWTGSGTSTMTKSYSYGNTINLSSVVTPTRKTGYIGTGYDLTSSSFGTLNGSTFTVGDGDATITINATGIETPVVTLSPESIDQIYNYQDVILTANNSTNYDSGILVNYSFGSASTRDGSYDYWGATSTPTRTIVKNDHFGTKYYKVRVYATDGSLNSDTVTSTSVASIKLENKPIGFDAGTGGTIVGTSPVYVKYGGASVYVSSTSNTTTNVPRATKDNYVFNGWYTSASDGSLVYSNDTNPVLQGGVNDYTNASGQWARTSGTTLYAQFEPRIYTITLNEQSGSGGTNAIYEKYATDWYSDATATTSISSITRPSRAGYTFGGYYTGQNGAGDLIINASGAIIASDTRFTMDTTIYAKWTPDVYTITYKHSNNVLGTQSCTYGTSVNLTQLDNLSDLTYVPSSTYGWSFVGWNSTVNNTTAEFQNGQLIQCASDIILYGIWQRNISFKYYNAADILTIDSVGPQFIMNNTEQGADVTDVNVPGLVAHTSYGWNPYGWTLSSSSYSINLSANATTARPSGQNMPNYYAVYSRTPVVTYNGNNATSGSVADTTFSWQYYHTALERTTSDVRRNLASNGFTRDGYLFSGWTEGSTSGTSYSEGERYSYPRTWNSLPTLTMYAKWTQNIVATANNVSLTYNGNPQSCAGGVVVTTPSSGYTITYRSEANGPNTSNAPTLTDVGDMAIYYTVSADGYNDTYGYYLCDILPATMNPVPSDNTKVYDGTPLSCDGNTWTGIPDESVINYSIDGGNNYNPTVPTITNVSESRTINWIATNPNYNDATGTFSCSVISVDSTITIMDGNTNVTNSESQTTMPNNKVLNVTCSNGAIPQISDGGNTTVATASISNSTITMEPHSAVGTTWEPGVSTIQVICPVNGNYGAVSASYTLKVYKGNCTITLTPTSGNVTYPTSTSNFAINWGNCNGTKTISSGNTDIATASFDNGNNSATVSYHSAGTTSITVASSQSDQYNAAYATYSATANDKTIRLNKNYGEGTCGGISGTAEGSMICTYGGTCVAPSWDSSTCDIAKGSKIFTGWNENPSGTGNDYTGVDLGSINVSVIYAKWDDIQCVPSGASVGHNANDTHPSSIITNNTPSCEVVCYDGYTGASPQYGSQNSTNVMYACTLANCNEQLHVKKDNGGVTYNYLMNPRTSYTQTTDRTLNVKFRSGDAEKTCYMTLSPRSGNGPIEGSLNIIIGNDIYYATPASTTN